MVTEIDDCLIAIVEPDGTGTAAYCYNDGHPLKAGVILRDHYNENTVRELVELSSIRTLGKSIQETVTYAQLMNRPKPDPIKFTKGLGRLFQSHGNRIQHIYVWSAENGWQAGSGKDAQPLEQLIGWHEKHSSDLPEKSP